MENTKKNKILEVALIFIALILYVISGIVSETWYHYTTIALMLLVFAVYLAIKFQTEKVDKTEIYYGVAIITVGAAVWWFTAR